jgi:hypothetical protein
MCSGVYTVVYSIYELFCVCAIVFLSAFSSVVVMLCYCGLNVVTAMPRSIYLEIEWCGGLLRCGGLSGLVAMVDGLRVTMLRPVIVTETMGVTMGVVKVIVIAIVMVYSRKVVDGCGRGCRW